MRDFEEWADDIEHILKSPERLVFIYKRLCVNIDAAKCYDQIPLLIIA